MLGERQYEGLNVVKILSLLVVAGILGCLSGISTAQTTQVTLAWDASTSPNVRGYTLYYGHSSRNYSTSINVGNKTRYTLTGLEAGTTYYFAVAAYGRTKAIRSNFSNEIRYPASTASSMAQMESPQSGSFESGVGLIRGWACQAGIVTIQIDGGAVQRVAYGTVRDDTAEICGDADNGFGYTINWNTVGEGAHNLRAFADGVEFANIDFTVSTLGVDYLQGASAEYVLSNFPATSNDIMLRWSEPHQNFVIANANPNAVEPLSVVTALPEAFPAYLESPQSGSFESGVGLIRGWACQAGMVAVQIDGGAVRPVAYGTARSDTVGVCGDANNGFGYTINWNTVGEGVHNLRAFVDGVEFANIDFTVTTFGVGYLQGASAEYVLSNFPVTGNSIMLRWSEPHQNFVITDGHVDSP
ncbi:MAG: fibronectin type III domain-containing protein [Phycisphaerales bacterium]|nr:fibronectin type III domain-containing protein [Phycisphaerales bacterium]